MIELLTILAVALAVDCLISLIGSRRVSQPVQASPFVNVAEIESDQAIRRFRVIADADLSPVNLASFMPFDYGCEDEHLLGFICRSVSYEMEHKAGSRAVWTVQYAFNQGTQV